MAGIPPLIGFFSKQFVLYSAVQNGYNFISLVAIIVSVLVLLII
jgi:NADH-ubiquinone oxidoreductase chain 2